MKDKLSAIQKKRIEEWVEDGFKLSDIQKKLDDELSIKITYIETRFLISDLNLTIKSDKPKESEEEDKKEVITDEDIDGEFDEQESNELESSVKVDVNKIAKPGMLAGGSVTFKNNQKAEWYVDQMGRMGVVPEEESFKPSPEDLQEMQSELQKVIQSGGL